MHPSRVTPARLGILGGTFDPIHLGHLVAASEAMHSLGLERVMLMPTGQPWQKNEYSDAEDRLMMTTLAAATQPRLSVSRLEIDRRGPTYSVDTLEQLHGFFPDAELYFILGADAALDLTTWHRIKEVSSLAQLVAVSRLGSDLTELPTTEGLPPIHVLDMPALAISSTEIRRRVAQGMPIDHLTPPGVVRFIRERGLYLDLNEASSA